MSEAPRPIAELRGDVPAPLAELVMRCLAKDPDDRPQSAGDIVRVLDTIASGSGTPVMPAVLMGGPGMFRKALAIYAAAFVVVAVVAKAAIAAIGLAGVGVSGFAHRDGAGAACRAVDGVRAARDAPRARRDADVHAGRHADEHARHDREHRAQGRAARELVPHGARRHVRVRRVRRAHRGVHVTARARHRAVWIAARGGPTECVAIRFFSPISRPRTSTPRSAAW